MTPTSHATGVPASSLADRTARAAPWRFAGSVTAALSQIVVGVLLARLLPPAEFGLMALALVVLGVVQPFGDLGIGGAVVQRSRLTDRHVRTAFTFSVLLGLAIAALTALAAPLAAAAARDPGVTGVVRVLSVAFACRGVAVVAEALLRRQLDFRRLFFIDTCSYTLGYGVIAVTLALRGYGAWSLVWGAMFQTLLASAAQVAVVRHDIRPLLAWRELVELLRFGLGAALSGWINYLALNGDNFVVGRWMGAASLGLYSRAYSLMGLPHTYVASVMSGVLFPAFAHVQGEPARLRRGYFLMTRLTAMIAAPSLAALAVAAPHLVVSLYGPQWSPVVTPLQVLCVAGYFRALYHLGGVVIQSVGRMYGEAVRQAVYAGLVIGGTLAARREGLPWVAAAVSVAILFMYVATGHAALRAIHSGWRPYLRAQVPALVIAALTGVVAICVRLPLEAHQAPSAIIAFTVLSAAAIPWSLGMLWGLGDPAFDPLRPYLPRWCLRLAETLRRRHALAPGTLHLTPGDVRQPD